MPTKPPDTISAGPIELRRRSLDDVPAMLAAVTMSLEHLRPWMPWAAQAPTEQSTREVAEKSIAQWDEGSEFVVACFETTTGELVGGAGLHRRIGDDGLEIGYWVRADRTRRGYTKAAAAALTRTAFTLDGIETVEIHCDAANLGSAAVPRSLGFTLAEEYPRDITAPGENGHGMTWRMRRGELNSSVAR